jgi:hypothetical protein
MAVTEITAGTKHGCKASSGPRFSMATLVHPQQNPLDLNVVGTRKGPWLIRVNAVMAEEESENVSLQLVLHSLDEEHPAETRRLYAVLPGSDLDIPQQRVLIADHIRKWIEHTEGNGFLDLGSRLSSG